MKRQVSNPEQIEQLKKDMSVKVLSKKQLKFVIGGTDSVPFKGTVQPSGA